MRRVPAIVLVLLSIPLLVFAKGATGKITLSAPDMLVEITDARALKDFHFGPGPGNFIGPAMTPNWEPNSWIVEGWDHPVAEPEHAFPRIKASFHIIGSNESREYVIYYVYDSATKQGYVYLPGRGEADYLQNTKNVYRGDEFEGHWFRATPEWTKEAQSAIEKAIQ